MAKPRLRSLIAGSDVLIEDVDLTRELGLEVDALVEGEECLVHCRISGWGPKGPWADLPASEIGAQLAAEVTTSLGRFGEAPVRVGADLASTYAGIYSVQAILAALYRRERDGLGQRIDVSLYGCLVVLALDHVGGPEQPGRLVRLPPGQLSQAARVRS